METLWFAVAAVMAAIYVVLDGYDFGAGALHLAVARDDRERRQVLAAIGPFWDGNEVWLLALGGVLFLAFPKLLASALSGFYLAIFLVVWTLMLRGIAIEFRSHLADGLWRRFWDGLFMTASGLAPVLFGAALGNVLRGVPLDASGWFGMPLWTDFLPSPRPGILDLYTVAVGVFALVALLHHGALYLAWKTDGAVEERARRTAKRLFWPLAGLWLALTWATARVNAEVFAGLARRPLAWAATALFLAGLAASFAERRRRPALAFAGSAAFLLGLLAATAASVYPTMLRSSLDPAWSLTAGNAAANGKALAVGFAWFPVGFVLALVYMTVLMRLHRGKVQAAAEGEGY
jgi:cytochrome d ubiquinol oxidase subunit II